MPFPLVFFTDEGPEAEGYHIVGDPEVALQVLRALAWPKDLVGVPIKALCGLYLVRANHDYPHPNYDPGSMEWIAALSERACSDCIFAVADAEYEWRMITEIPF